MTPVSENIDKLNGLSAELRAAEGVRLYDLKLNEEPPVAAPGEPLPEGVKNMYRELDGFILNWRHAKYDNPVVKGLSRILSANEMQRSGEGILWFANSEKDDPIRNFAIIDFFVDEACVGVYRQAADESLYFYGFEDKPLPLHLDMKGYITMLVAARAFWYWPLVIVDINTDDEHPETVQFREFMPAIFPDFNFDAFKKLYQSIKLK